MCGIIAESAADAESSSEALVYVLLRDSAASEWTESIVQEIWKSKIRPQARRFSYRCKSSFKCGSFQGIGFQFSHD
eukprot:6452491-Karenia_brevis.AAC.1